MKKRILALAAMVLLVAPYPAMATTSVLSFNDSVQGWIDVASWDWNAGNALAKGSIPLSTDVNNPTSFDLYYQADLGNFLDVNGTAIGGTGLNLDYEITLQAGFSELGSRVDNGTLFSKADFILDPNAAVNFIDVYIDFTRDANNLLGTGFDDGIKLMSGMIDVSTGAFTVFVDLNQDGLLDVVPLDGFGTNNYPGVYTLSGQGTAVIEASIDVADVNGTYIDTTGINNIGWYLNLFFNSSTIAPFLQQNPSTQVAGHTPTFGIGLFDDPTLAGVNPIWGPVNGFGLGIQGGEDFLFQADGNSSVSIVPEPSTIVLLGAGLIGLGLVARRRK